MNKERVFLPIVILVLLFAVATPAPTQVLFWGGGVSDLADGTALPTEASGLSGTWNNALTNWSASATPGVYQTFTSGAFANLGYMLTTNGSATAGLVAASDVQVAGFFACLTQTAGSGQRFLLTNSAPTTLTFPTSGATIVVAANANGIHADRQLEFHSNVVLSGSAPLHVMGTARTEVRCISTNLTGPVYVRSALRVPRQGTGSSHGSLAGVSNFYVQTIVSEPGTMPFYPVLFVNAPNFVGAVNQLHDAAAVELSCGIFEYIGRQVSTGPTRETMGKIVLRAHGMLDVDTVTDSSTNVLPQLILSDATAGIDRGPAGRGTLMVKVNNLGNPTNDVIVQNGIPTGQLLPWIGTTRSEFMQLDPAKTALVTVASTPAPEALGTWATDANYRIGNSTAWTSTASIASDLTINSLGFYSTSATTVLVDNAATLNIGSGALAMYPVGQNQNIIGGKLTSTNDALYFLLPDSNANGDFLINSSIVGDMDLVVGGYSKAVVFGGSSTNTYAGTTYINGGTLKANKSTTTAVAVPGDLVVEFGGLFDAAAGLPVSASSVVTVNEGGQFKNAVTVTHGGTLVINGGSYWVNNGGHATLTGGLAFNGGRIAYITTGNASISLQSGVSYGSDSTQQALWEIYYTNGFSNFAIELDGAARTFNIADSATLPTGTPEMVVDARIKDGSPAGGSLVKSGSGTLTLTETNSYTGGTVVQGGVLQVSAIRAEARSGLFGATSPGGVFSRILTFNQPIARTLVNRQPITSPSTGINVIRTNTIVLNALNDYQISSGNAGFVSATNLTDIALGAVWRGGTLGSGPVTINNGTLQVDGDITITNTATLGGGTFLLNGTYNGNLTMTNGTLAGTGTVVKATTVNGVLAPGNSIGTINFSGSLDIGSSGALRLELGSAGSDRVNVAGVATLGGTLEVVNVAASLVEGASFTGLTANLLSGTFAATNLPALGGGLVWNVSYDNDEVVLSISAGGPVGPTVGPVSLVRAYGQPLHVPVSLLMTNASSPGGGSLTCSWVSVSSSNGHPVSLAGEWVYYTPPASSNETDYFNFRLADTNGLWAESTATVLVEAPVTNVVTISSGLTTNGGVVGFSWSGIAGRTNQVEGATELGPTPPANWSNLAAVVLDGIGRATFQETNPPSPRYYRVTE